MQSFTVKIRVDTEAIESLKSLLAAHPHREKWRDWKDYARTLAYVGFHDHLRQRAEADKRCQEIAERIDAQNEHDECVACRGYGYFDEAGIPTTDKRGRRCLDCTGTGFISQLHSKG